MSIVNAAVDWVTMTTKEDEVGSKWYRIYVKYRDAKIRETNRETPFHNGYYAGLGIAQMKWGYSETIGYILIVHGSDAERLWENLRPAMHRVTRLDLCVDVVLKTARRLAHSSYTALLAQEGMGNRKYSLFENSYGGATCYVGSRQSQQFGRLYDKGVQAGTHEQGLKWRAEVEYKKPLAGFLAKALSEVPPEERQGAILGTVAKWYSDRGVDADWLEPGGRWLSFSVEERITTADKKLAWLRTQVAPSVVELVEAGYGRQVLDCLMLDHRRLDEIEGVVI